MRTCLQDLYRRRTLFPISEQASSKPDRLYNLCPTQDIGVLRLVDGERQFEEMRWQLVPNFEPEFTTKLSTINAKSETVFESRLFGELIMRPGCIVLISGFFEWKVDGQLKRPCKAKTSNVLKTYVPSVGCYRMVGL